MTKNHTKPLKVSFINNDVDFKVATLANWGWHTRAIAKETGLTESQVNYRCMNSGIRRRDYRDGMNEHSKRVLVAQDILFSKIEIKTIRREVEDARIDILLRIKKKAAALKKQLKQKK